MTATGGSTASGGAGCGVPTSFKWTSSKALITPRSGAVSIKDPSVVFFDNKWQIFATDSQACPSERGSEEPIDMSICTDLSNAKCTKDADCTGGKTGRCTTPYNEPCYTECSYDDCLTDSDCAVGPCVCRTSGMDATKNECLLGSTCRTDSDCGDCGYCSASATLVGHDCRANSPTYNCHTATDECSDANDCVDGGLSYCAYGAVASTSAARWACGYCFPYPIL